MSKKKRFTLKLSRFSKLSLVAALPLCLLIVAGCFKPPETTAPSVVAADNRAKGGGGSGGRQGGRGGGGPVAANATGAEIYQSKCRCHGAEGSGGRAPVLTGLAGRPDTELYQIIHDGHGKMPAFGTQLTKEQIDKVVGHIKQLAPKT